MGWKRGNKRGYTVCSYNKGLIIETAALFEIPMAYIRNIRNIFLYLQEVYFSILTNLCELYKWRTA